jgi:hypothetical protein
LATRQDEFAIAFTKTELMQQLQTFFDRNQSHASLAERFRLCTSAHFNFHKARREVSLQEAIKAIHQILYRPFDTRYVVYHPLLIGEPRPEVMRHLLSENLALLSTRRVTGGQYNNVFITRGLVLKQASFLIQS